MINSILTICIGNICRSPMAEGLLANALPDVRVNSAGIGALVGHKADPQAVQLMQERGLDISGHVAQQITGFLCQQADLILVMDLEQQRFIETKYINTRGKVFRLAEAFKQDVKDPYRRDREAFEQALNLIEAGSNAWIDRIEKLTRKRATI